MCVLVDVESDSHRFLRGAVGSQTTEVVTDRKVGERSHQTSLIAPYGCVVHNVTAGCYYLGLLLGVLAGNLEALPGTHFGRGKSVHGQNVGDELAGVGVRGELLGELPKRLPREHGH